jgi:hypothetical protein
MNDQTPDPIWIQFRNRAQERRLAFPTGHSGRAFYLNLNHGIILTPQRPNALYPLVNLARRYNEEFELRHLIARRDELLLPWWCPWPRLVYFRRWSDISTVVEAEWITVQDWLRSLRYRLP